jgi:HJR/Mrr/RecB family endonuclease
LKKILNTTGKNMTERIFEYFLKIFARDRYLVKLIIQEFKNDYVDNLNLSKKVSPDVASDLQLSTKLSHSGASKSFNEKQEGGAAVQVFFSLHRFYILLWLEETGYGEKLALRRSQLLHVDEYGDLKVDDWLKELNRFVSDRLFKIDSYLTTSIPNKYQRYARSLKMIHELNPNFDIHNIYSTKESRIDHLAMSIELLLDLYIDRLENNQSLGGLDSITDPYEYEAGVSEAFESLGWICQQTPGSGDQGADVIAKKDGFKLAVQCKLYSSSVGNKAVQEASASKGYYKADLSIVVSNSNFTKSAKQLAESLGVALIHHSQISAFDNGIFNDRDMNKS